MQRILHLNRRFSFGAWRAFPAFIDTSGWPFMRIGLKQKIWNSGREKEGFSVVENWDARIKHFQPSMRLSMEQKQRP